MTGRVPHPIERESYRILRSRVDTGDLGPLTRAVVERVVHTTADPSWAGEFIADESTLAEGRTALLDGAPLITDVRMLAAGITSRPARSALDAEGVGELAAAERLTRSAAGMRIQAMAHPDGAVFAVGNAPTALFELTGLCRAGLVRPALVVGLPVGFVGALESKGDLRDAGVPCLVNRTERGGSTIAAAAVNALLYAESELG